MVQLLILATSQLKRLDKMIEIRKQNYRKFIDIISSHPDKFFIPENTELNSSFCFPIISKDPNRNQIIKDEWTKIGKTKLDQEQTNKHAVNSLNY